MDSAENNGSGETPVRVYRENPKHKRGAFGGGPPRWFPDYDTPCPRDITTEMAQELLDRAVPWAGPADAEGKALFALDDQGRFFKAHCHSVQGEEEHWHGYPVNEDRVPREIPARVLREFKKRGILSPARYKKLLGSSR